jgi:purine-binding chemotaxis protein CheW
MDDAHTPARFGVETQGEERLDLLLVQAADELYGLPGTAVRELRRWRAPTPVPGAPPVIPGIIGQRGVVLPVVDLRLALGLPAAAPGRTTRLVLIHHELADLALCVDAVLDLLALPAAAQTQPPATLDPTRARLISAVTRLDDRPLALLNLAALIAAVQEGL